jgi:hypothetical protein
MKRITLMIVVITMVLAFIKPCIAEPDSTIRYLITEPVTLLDFGLYRLTEEIDTHFAKIEYTSGAYMFYDWDANRINIIISGPAGKFKTKKEAKDWCEWAVCEVRKELGLDCSSLRSSIPAGTSMLSLRFNHLGHKSRNEPKDLGNKLDKITIIKIDAGYGKNSRISCSVPLLGADVMCTD